MGGIILQLLADIAHDHAQIFDVAFIVAWPDRGQKLLVRDHAPRETGKFCDHGEFLGGEMYFLAAPMDAALDEVDRDVASLDLRSAAVRDQTAAQGDAHAC